MISYLTYIIFENLPVEKEQEIKDWAKAQYNDDCWYFSSGRLKEEYGGSFCVETNYHYSRLRVPLYIFQLYKKYHDCCNMRVEVWDDFCTKPGEFFATWYTLDNEKDWQDFLKEYPDEPTIKKKFDDLREEQKEEQIAFVNALKAVDNIKKTQGE